jgi:HAD superfamily hydrolase (TIGR01509 family)
LSHDRITFAMTSLPAPEALLFDLDGTLVDTVGTRVASWIDIFKEEGIPADPEFVAPLMGSDGRFAVQRVAEEAGITIDAARVADIDDRAGARFSQLNRSPRALPGVAALVAHLEANGISWAVATSSQPGQVQASIDALGLATAPMVTDGSHVAHAKPAPDLLLSAAKQMGRQPVGIWYIGDAKWDMLAAAAAGMTAIAVMTGATSVDVLTESGADAVFDDLNGVLTHLEESA